ncbi:MAG: Uma2 family endonuclease [SAR202 cluster bacterium]|nr:Uma2 family endonuclease [SAR202 cluster bacterium]MDP6714954.1 Uma2 family endonuclease [SAR202 cluster bacterium]
MTTKQAQHVTRHRFSVDDYYRMAEVGILTHEERVELVLGEIVEMAPIGDRHASSVDRLAESLTIQINMRAIIRSQNPLRLNQDSVVQPDLVLLARRDDYYASTTPDPNSVLLLVEVSDTTLLYDRNVKLPLYARSGVPEVWIVDLQSGQLEVFTEPSDDGYGSSRTLSSEDSVSPSAFDDISLAVADIIP